MPPGSLVARRLDVAYVDLYRSRLGCVPSLALLPVLALAFHEFSFLGGIHLISSVRCQTSDSELTILSLSSHHFAVS